MAVALDPTPVSRLHKGDFVADCNPEDLIYFLLNVGDGDTQLVLLPADADGTRQVMIVDAIKLDKLEGLLQSLAQTPLMPARSPLFAVVVATHPHDDHIAGMPGLIETYSQQIPEFWEPGYYHTSEAYIETMHALEDHPEIRHTQPTSGMTRYIGQVRVTVLAPGIGLRNRFDSYGIEINDSSIAVKLEFPTSRVEQRRSDRSYVRPESVRSLILGADSQTLSWAQVMIDFPQLGPDESVVSQALQKARGVRPLAAEVVPDVAHEALVALGVRARLVRCGPAVVRDVRLHLLPGGHQVLAQRHEHVVGALDGLASRPAHPVVRRKGHAAPVFDHE